MYTGSDLINIFNYMNVAVAVAAGSSGVVSLHKKSTTKLRYIFNAKVIN